MDVQYSMKLASIRSGLTPHLIRAWERRYHVLTPARTPTDRRAYTDADIEKLSLLRCATEAGHTIGRIAHLSTSELRELTSANTSDRSQSSFTGSGVERAADSDREPKLGDSAPSVLTCMQMVREMNREGFEHALNRANLALGIHRMIDEVLVPTIESLGSEWSEGRIRPAQEHLATAVLRTHLGRLLGSESAGKPAPRLVVTTPAGQFHELGALLVAVTAATMGWSVVYLGPNLPAAEIAAAVVQTEAGALALSIVYPPDDPRLHAELLEVAAHLEGNVSILVGGASAPQYVDTLSKVDAILVADIRSLRTVLQQLRH